MGSCSVHHPLSFKMSEIKKARSDRAKAQAKRALMKRMHIWGENQKGQTYPVCLSVCLIMRQEIILSSPFLQKTHFFQSGRKRAPPLLQRDGGVNIHTIII